MGTPKVIERKKDELIKTVEDNRQGENKEKREETK